MALDRTDFDILDALQNDARLSNKQLAARIGLAPSSCLERVRRLREGGVLGDAHAEVNPEVMGIGLQAMVAVRIQQQSRQVIESFHAHMVALPEVLVVYHLSGANDFLLHVAVRDPEHLRGLVLDEISGRPEVQHVETALVFDHQRRSALPNYVSEEP
jgi:DNA-binding Lrp family transcriptional regulator